MQLDVDKFIDITFREGVISTLIGLPEGGKSNLACNFIEMLVPRGYHVYTNIAFFDLSEVEEAMQKNKLAYVKDWKKWYRKVPPEVHTVRSLSELFIGLLSNEPNVAILDEAGIHAPSKRATGKEAVNWEMIAFIIRHLSSALCQLIQVKGSLTPALRSTLTQVEMKIRKLSERDRMFTIGTATEVIDDLTGESFIKFEVAEGDEFHYIEKTRYPYDGKDFPYFDMNLDLKETYKRLSTREDGTPINSLEIRRKVPGTDKTLGQVIIEELLEETNPKNTGIRKHKLLTITEYARLKGVTYQTVRNWIIQGKLRAERTPGGSRRIHRDEEPII